MGLDAGVCELFGHEAPAGTAFQRKRHLVLSRETAQPAPERLASRRPDLAGHDLARLGVQNGQM